jgi:hypothetical protein
MIAKFFIVLFTILALVYAGIYLVGDDVDYMILAMLCLVLQQQLISSELR